MDYMNILWWKYMWSYVVLHSADVRVHYFQLRRLPKFSFKPTKSKSAPTVRLLRFHRDNEPQQWETGDGGIQFRICLSGLVERKTDQDTIREGKVIKFDRCV